MNMIYAITTALCAAYPVFGGWFVYWLTPDEQPLTWGGAVRCTLLGLLWPLIVVTLASIIVSRAPFWSKPIFKNSRR